jgi:hypothetical protein
MFHGATTALSIHGYNSEADDGSQPRKCAGETRSDRRYRYVSRAIIASIRLT